LIQTKLANFNNILRSLQKGVAPIQSYRRLVQNPFPKTQSRSNSEVQLGVILFKTFKFNKVNVD